MMQQPKNCPFCRGVAMLEGASYSGPADCWDTVVRCTNCDAKGPIVLAQHGNDELARCEQAISLWNGRTIEGADLTDAFLGTVIEAQGPDRIQGFSYPPRYVIRDVFKPWGSQEIWSIDQAVIGADQLFQRQCEIEKLRSAIDQALGR